MNVYDFDGTIYDGDSTIDFYLFVLRKHPLLLWTILPNVLNAILFKCRRISRQTFKERHFRLILPRIDVSKTLEEFWKSHKQRIKEWYRAQIREDDVIISASPRFLLQPVCDDLDIHLIATTVDPLSGLFAGTNLRGEEKVLAFQKLFPSTRPKAFYTDHKSDAPMIAFAEEAYVVRGETLYDASSYNLSRSSGGRFMLVGGFNTVLDFAILNGLSLLGLPAIAANTCSTGIAMTSSFILNKKYTFESTSKSHGRDIALFIIFTLIGLWIIQNLIVHALLIVFPTDWPLFIKLNGAKVLGTGASMLWNFLSYKYIVFPR